MPLLRGKANIGRNIKELEEHGSRPRSHKQILAIALHEAAKRASGGGLGDTSKYKELPFGDDAPEVMIQSPEIGGLGAAAQGIPYALQQQAYEAAQKAQALPQLSGDEGFSKGGIAGALNFKPPHALSKVTEPVAAGGFLHSVVPGRTDRLATRVRTGSHIIPADVVSSLGQGNSLAGARHLDLTMRSLPTPSFARGGHPHRRFIGKGEDHMPVLLAGGEYVIEPEEVAALGHGDHKKGHDILDKMIVRVRRAEAKRMLKLPGPKK